MTFSDAAFPGPRRRLEVWRVLEALRQSRPYELPDRPYIRTHPYSCRHEMRKVDAAIRSAREKRV